MGMFDTFHVSLPCPLDGFELRTWQGKDGPCALLDWRQGAIEPDQAEEGHKMALQGREAYLARHSDVPGSCGLGTATARDAAALRWGWMTAAIDECLPATFGLYANCGDHWVDALGETDAEARWTITRVVSVSCGMGRGMDYRQVALWRAGEALPEGLAARAANHEAMRLTLPAHGGDAVCAGFGHEPPMPAEVWAGRPLCEMHLALAREYDPGIDESAVR